MRNTLAITSIVVLTLVGCVSAKVGKIQDSCEASTQNFQAMAVCLKTNITADQDMASTPEVKLYLLKADQLSERVSSGAISQLDARVELQALYVDLKNQEDSKSRSVRVYAQPVPKPKQTRCNTINGIVNCATY